MSLTCDTSTDSSIIITRHACLEGEHTSSYTGGTRPTMVMLARTSFHSRPLLVHAGLAAAQVGCHAEEAARDMQATDVS